MHMVPGRQNSAAKWKRALWKRTSRPDNYVPDSFLSSLRRNGEFPLYGLQMLTLMSRHILANFQPYTYWYLVTASWSISQHLATIFIFLAVFVKLRERILDPRLLVWISVVCFATGYSIWEVLEGCSSSRNSAPANSP